MFTVPCAIPKEKRLTCPEVSITPGDVFIDTPNAEPESDADLPGPASPARVDEFDAPKVSPAVDCSPMVWLFGADVYAALAVAFPFPLIPTIDDGHKTRMTIGLTSWLAAKTASPTATRTPRQPEARNQIFKPPRRISRGLHSKTFAIPTVYKPARCVAITLVRQPEVLYHDQSVYRMRG